MDFKLKAECALQKLNVTLFENAPLPQYCAEPKNKAPDEFTPTESAPKKNFGDIVFENTMIPFLQFFVEKQDANTNLKRNGQMTENTSDATPAAPMSREKMSEEGILKIVEMTEASEPPQ